MGEDYEELKFKSDMMFRKRRDALARQVDFPVEVWDFFDVGGLWDRQEKVAGTGMAMTVVGVLGTRMVGGFGWVDGFLGAAKIVGVQNFRRMLVPSLLATGSFSANFHILNTTNSV